MVDIFPEMVDIFPEIVDIFPEKVDSRFLKRLTFFTKNV